MRRFRKHPDAKPLCTIRLTNLDTREVASAAFDSDPVGLTFSGIATTIDTARSFIENGTDGTNYKVDALITLDNGEVFVVEFDVQVINQ